MHLKQCMERSLYIEILILGRRFKINDLSFHFKKLEAELTIPTVNRRMEIKTKVNERKK